MRKPSAFRNWDTADGSAGPSGVSGFKAKAGRYRLYVSRACPWEYRTLIFRALMDLEDMIDISVVHWFMGPDGWTFAPGDGSRPDPTNNATFLNQVYTAAKPDFTGRVTVPVQWDKPQGAIVSNESADTIRIFNAGFATTQTANEVAFDPVYVGHFKCNLRRIADYPNLSGDVRDLYQHPDVAETVDIAYIKKLLLRQP